MKRKYSTFAAIAFSAALTLHLTDQAARFVQESSLFAPPAKSCPYSGQLPVSFLPSGGLGAMIEGEPRGARLVSLMPGHAASRAGLKLGDRITSIDGVRTYGRDSQWSISRLRGKIGTSVRLEIERGEGIWQRSFAVELTRESIDSVSSVYSRVRDGELTLKVLWLDSSTAQQLTNHLSQATREDVNSVVLDLSNVSYGDASAVAECASLFLPQGTTVGYLVSDCSSVKSISPAVTTQGFAVTDQLSAIKVGPYTARGGEMLAKALVDHLGVEVQGEKTAGLGTLDGRTIRSRVNSSGENNFQLLDSRGERIEGRALSPSFWSWSNLMSAVPSGLE